MGKGRVLVKKQVVEVRGRFGCQGPFYLSGVNDYLFSDGFLLSLRMCKRGFHDLLRVRTSSVLML